MSLSGNVSAESAAKVGQLTGAKVLVTGRVFFGRQRSVHRRQNHWHGEQIPGLWRIIVNGSAASHPWADLSDELAKKISKFTLPRRKVTTLISKSETREQRIEKIVAALKGDKRPSVSVKIDERHFGAPGNRWSAAETELTAILQKCGFHVIDEKIHRESGY